MQPNLDDEEPGDEFKSWDTGPMKIGRTLVALTAIATSALTVVDCAYAEDVKSDNESLISLDLALGLGGFLSTWSDDGGGAGALKLGGRLWDTVGLQALTRLGYASVDQRLLTFLSLGVQVWPIELGAWSPYLRIAGFHQHEESMAAVDQNPGGAVFGVGDGIRHRYGTEAAIGTEYRVRNFGSTDLYVAAELTGALAFASSGPDGYAGFYLFFGLLHGL